MKNVWICQVNYSTVSRYTVIDLLLTLSVVSEELLPGWQIGLSTMRRGEKSKFLLTPEYGFKELGCRPRVPLSATGLCCYSCSSKLK